MLNKGMEVSDLVAAVLIDLSDVDQQRWTSPQIVNYMNEGLRELAKECVFRRVDYQRVTANKSVYQTFAECARIGAVWFDLSEIPAALDNSLTGEWRDDTGTPYAYVPLKDGVRLYPIPTVAGDAYTLGAPTLTETQGGTIMGDGYSAALNGTTVVHFLEGDGVCTNADTATGNLRIEYAYYPQPVGATDNVPAKFATALILYALWRCFSLSEAPEEVARSQVIGPNWQREVRKLAVEADPRSFSNATRFGRLTA